MLDEIPEEEEGMPEEEEATGQSSDASLFSKLEMTARALTAAALEPLRVTSKYSANIDYYVADYYDLGDGERTIRERTERDAQYIREVIEIHRRIQELFGSIVRAAANRDRENVAKMVSRVCERLEDYSDLVNKHQRDCSKPFLFHLYFDGFSSISGSALPAGFNPSRDEDGSLEEIVILRELANVFGKSKSPVSYPRTLGFELGNYQNNLATLANTLKISFGFDI